MKGAKRKICECKLVAHAEIVGSIRNIGCRTILDIQNATGAFTGCGRCKPVGMELLMKAMQREQGMCRQLRLPFLKSCIIRGWQVSVAASFSLGKMNSIDLAPL